jgi:hypothetical protein
MNMNRRVRRGWLLLPALIAGKGGGWAAEPPAPLTQARALLRSEQTPKPEQLAAALKALPAQGDNWAEAAFLRAELALKIGDAPHQEIARKTFEELAANPDYSREEEGLARELIGSHRGNAGLSGSQRSQTHDALCQGRSDCRAGDSEGSF